MCFYPQKGKIEEIFYDEKGVEYECYYLDANSECRGCVVPKGIWYIIDVGWCMELWVKKKDKIGHYYLSDFTR